MKKFPFILFFILALVGTTGVPPVVHAGQTDATDGCPIGQVMDGFGSCATQTTIDTQNAAAIAAQKVAEKSATDSKASSDSAYNGIMIKIMSLFAWLAGVAMVTLNYATYYTVVSMGAFVSQLSAIGVTWRILRDIGNIMLIFGFLAIGISVILNVNWYGGKTKMLPMLLVGAIFLNFSLFFTEAVIDTGNLFATQFYKQINGGDMPTEATLGNQGISDKIMSQLGLQTIYGQTTNSDTAKKIFEGGNPWIIGFMGILLFIILAFVLFSLAFILIARFVILIFLIILAPIGFAGLAIPRLAGTAKRWWNTLFEQTITAPVLMLLLYIALNVITDAQFLTGLGNGGRADWLGTVKGDIAGFAPVLISFFVAMGLLLAVTISAKKLSAFGADTVSKIGTAAKNSATKLAMSPVRYVGRTAKDTGKWAAHQTGGRLAANFAQQVRTSDTFKNTQLGRITATTLDKGSKGFRELEKKTDEKHQEYKKSVDAALDKQALPDVVAAKQATDVATSEMTVAKDRQKEIEKETQPLFIEVARLKKLAGNGPFIDPKIAKDLAEAEKNVVEALKKRVTVDDAAREAEEKSIAAKDAETAVTKSVTEAKKESALAYAKNIQAPVTATNPISWAKWIASGTHAQPVANKIIKDTLSKESDGDKLLKIVKDSLKKEAEVAAKKSAGGGTSATPAPATPSPHGP